MQDLTEQLGRLPWRGEVIPVFSDAPEDKQPVNGMSVKVELLDMSRAEDRDEYAMVLNRHYAGYAKILEQPIMQVENRITVLLVWGELYQSGPGFVPEEARPVLLSNALPNPAFVGDEGPRTVPVFGDVSNLVPAAAAEEEKASEPLFQGPPILLQTRDLAVVEEAES